MVKTAPQLYIDSADRAASEPLLDTGVFRGLTTNPAILERANRTVDDLPEIYSWACAAGAEEVCFQVWGRDAETLSTSASRILEIDADIVVKVPATRSALTLGATLANQGADVLVTAVYSASQMLLAQSIGAKYIAPYVGRMADLEIDVSAQITAMQAAAASSAAKTTILAASLRSVATVVELMALGVPGLTVAPELASALLDNEHSMHATEAFEAAIERAVAD